MKVFEQQKDRKNIGFNDKNEEQKYWQVYNAVLSQWPEFIQEKIETPYGISNVVVCGKMDGPPLILLHGRYTPSISWSPMIEELSRYHRVYAIDTMGEPGLSESDGTPLKSAHNYVEWLSAIIDELGLDEVNIAAHSFSGWYATHFSLTFPHRVKTLTLLDPAQVFAQFKVTWLLNCIPSYIFPSERTIHSFYKWIMQGNKVDTDIQELLTIGMTSYAANKEEASLIPGSLLKTLSVPAQQILAADTVVHNVTRAVKRANKFSPHVESYILPHCSHMIQSDKPNIASDLIIDFTHRSH